MTSQVTNLPVQLRPTKLIESTHKFVYQINALMLSEHADNLYRIYKKYYITTDLPP